MSKTSTLYSFFTEFLAVLTAWSNPAASVKTEVVIFLNVYPREHVRTINVNGRSLQYVWTGNRKKRPLLFVHGSPGSWEAWAHFLVNKQLQQKYHIISVDRPGFGGSEEGRVEPSLRTQAELVTASLKDNESGLPAIVVGHSFGGPVIAQMAISYPEKIGGLVFVATSVAPEFEKIKWFQYPATWWPIRSLIPAKLKVCNEEIFPLKEELVRILPEWKKITAKVAIIHGELDPLVPVGNLDFLTKNLDPKTIIKISRIPNLNHFIPWVRPDLILDGIFSLEGGLQ